MVIDDDSWTAVETCEASRETIAPASVSLTSSDLYFGETIDCMTHVVQILPQDQHQKGFLCLTTFRLLFVPYPKTVSSRRKSADIALCNIAEVVFQDPRATASAMSHVGFSLGMTNGPERVGGDAQENTNSLEIACKNFEILQFHVRVNGASISLHSRLIERLESLHQAAPLAFAYETIETNDANAREIEEAESARMDLTRSSTSVAARDPSNSGGFRISHINQTFRLSATYPALLVVPRHISDADLKTISHFRARGRIPAITYRHRDNDTLLARCAQPLVGLRRRRCAHDEFYVKTLQQHARGGLYIIDCRHQTSAYGNIALGAGFEIAEYYNNVPLLFMNIENIHSMRDSIRRLFELVKGEVRGSEKSNWLSCLEGTRWLEHVRSILIASTICVDKMVDEHASLLVHCSDGWDRTAQITSLVKVCCDPYYRTVEGFAVLIQQEWISFGHRFESRCGMKSSQSSKKGYWDDEQTSPVFVQFIDAIWQMTQQAPCSFEFNERYLVALLDEVYSRRSGTFLFDCEEQRLKARVHTRCPSAWNLLEKVGDIYNPFYIVPGDGLNVKSPCVLRFRWHTSTMSIWSAFYLRSLEHREGVINQNAWAKNVQKNQEQLQVQLSEAKSQLTAQMELNAKLQAHVAALESKTIALHSALQGQVYSEPGVVVHEAMEDTDFDEGVLLSVTQTTHVEKRDLFIAATMFEPFEVISSYFDAAENSRRID
ncbi:hypothetical protein AC1031_001606 [Aphanomyces cochlioides]|nr:hypothetical protein AC1031_001606 [Aphanomyces cochlioides]